MRNTQWLRFGLASTLATFTGLGIALVACSDDLKSTVEPKTDAAPATDGALPTEDAGTTDAGTIAKLTLVNAAVDLGPDSALNGRGDAAIRICFKQGTTIERLSVAGYPPLPDKASGPAPLPGIPYGTGGTFPSFGLDLSGLVIVPIIMNAKTLKGLNIVNPGNGSPGTTCDEIVGERADAGLGLVANRDYWELPPIPAGTFKKEEAFVLVLTGCVGNATIAERAKCGPGMPVETAPGRGNLRVEIFNTVRTPISATQLGVQFIHASPQGNALLDPFPIEPVFVSAPVAPADAGVTQPATAAPVSLLKMSPLLGVTGVKATDSFALSKNTPLPDGKPLGLLPLPLIQLISAFPASPSIFADGTNVVFLAVGDPQIKVNSNPAGPDAGDAGPEVFDSRTLHYLAFPTDPTIVSYKP